MKDAKASNSNVLLSRSGSNHNQEENNHSKNAGRPLFSGQRSEVSQEELSNTGDEKVKKLNFLTAWLIPGVLLYSSAFFCLKFAVYSMLLWLQLYLRAVNFTTYESANVSTLFDVGALLGSMALGYLSDKLWAKRSPVAFGAILVSIALSYIITFENMNMSKGTFMFMMFLFGFFISGLNNLV